MKKFFGRKEKEEKEARDTVRTCPTPAQKSPLGSGKQTYNYFVMVRHRRSQVSTVLLSGATENHKMVPLKYTASV